MRFDWRELSREVDSVYLASTEPEAFGFLPFGEPLCFPGGYIAPVDNYRDILMVLESQLNIFNTYHPSLECRRLRHCPEMFKLPSSHTMHFSKSTTRAEVRDGKGAFIMHLLGTFFEIPLQFFGWRFSSSLRIDPAVFFALTLQERKALPEFLGVATRFWEAMPELPRKRVTNLLYLHNLSGSRTFMSEQFLYAYAVTDAIHKVSVDAANLPIGGTHAKRIEKMCNFYGIPFFKELAQQIVSLRNDLFHEGVWAEGAVMDGATSEAISATFALRRLNRQLITALLGYPNEYSRSDWRLQLDHFDFIDYPDTALIFGPGRQTDIAHAMKNRSAKKRESQQGG